MYSIELNLCPYCSIPLRRNEIEEHILSTPYCLSAREKEEEGDYSILDYRNDEVDSQEETEYLPIWYNLIETEEENEQPHPDGEDEIGTDSFTCVICVTNKPQIMGKCSHLCCCFTCSKKIYNGNNLCPVCRTLRNSLIHVFTN